MFLLVKLFYIALPAVTVDRLKNRVSARVRISFLLALFLCSPDLARAQWWANTYGGADDEFPYSIQQTSDGGYIVAGLTASFGAGNEDIWVLKLNSYGTVTWQSTYGGAGDERAESVQQTSDGGYIVAGETWSFGMGSGDIWVLKLNDDGTMDWQRTYGGSNYDRAFSIQQTSDGGYIVAGFTYSFGAGSEDIWVLKLNDDGTVVWQKTYGGASDEWADSIQQTSDGGYIVSGFTYSFGAGGHDIWVLKLNDDGSVAWQKTYGGSGRDSADSIQQTSDGGYIVSGFTYSFGAGGYDIWVLKLNDDGSVAWQKTYGGSDWDWAFSIQQTSDGGYIVSGETWSFGAGSGDIWVLKLNDDGSVAWQKTYGGAGRDWAFSIQQTSDGGYIVAGGTSSFGAGSGDIWVLKLNGSGNISGCAAQGTSGATETLTIVTPGASNVTPGTTYVSSLPTSATSMDTTVTPEVVCSAALTVISPNGGEVIPSGSIYNLQWLIHSNVVKFDLQYSLNNGTTWNPIASKVTGSSYNWTVLKPTANKKNCLVKVIGYDASNVLVGQDTSDAKFTIEVVKVTSPNGGENWKVYSIHPITWTTNGTKKPVAKVKLYYTTGLGIWNFIRTVIGNPGTSNWKVPAAASANCKVKVVLKDALGKTMGTDPSDSFFMIGP